MKARKETPPKKGGLLSKKPGGVAGEPGGDWGCDFFSYSTIKNSTRTYLLEPVFVRVLTSMIDVG
jgi:hypothetical protein